MKDLSYPTVRISGSSKLVIGWDVGLHLVINTRTPVIRGVGPCSGPLISRAQEKGDHNMGA